MTEELEPSAKKSCADCDLGLLAFGHRYLGNAELCFQYLVRHGVLRDQLTCKKCGELCRLYFNQRVFKCQKLVRKLKKKPQRCNFQQSVYHNTWLHNSHLDIESNVLFIYMYLTDYFSYQGIRDEITGISDKTISEWSSYCRDVLIHWCQVNSSKQIGGPGLTVEIDELKLKKRKNKEDRITESMWVMGGLCCETKEFFAVEVDKWDKDSLSAVIEEKVCQESTVINNCWKRHSSLQDEEFQHLEANHELNNVDLEADPHANNLGNKRKKPKRKVPQYGNRAYCYEGFLAKAAFMLRYPETSRRMHPFLLAVAQRFPPGP
ncbi:uncharacterized protein LOC134776576 [Penaeus indicus]|uniref:uncharacterized protein LOC134776576 n=1 Tax=Penaeus indicus TaxID=29960 RepID=UPI00300CE9EA